MRREISEGDPLHQKGSTEEKQGQKTMPYLTSAKGVALDHYSAPEKNAKGAPFD